VVDDLRALVQVDVGDRVARFLRQVGQLVHPAVERAADVAHHIGLGHGHLDSSHGSLLGFDASLWLGGKQPRARKPVVTPETM
jgi:hypothetical protein